MNSLRWLRIPVVLAASTGLAASLHLAPLDRGRDGERDADAYPSDWFGAQRAFPFGIIPQEKFRAAFEQATVERAILQQKPGLTASLNWQDCGPYNIGGRVTALAVAPGGTTIYLASANGGVLKSVNSGTNWSPVFDAYGVFSIGALALQPGNPAVLYVGTGEANSAVDSYDGAGLFRSTDSGASFQYIGLQETRRIARVAVDPSNTNRVFVAAMGTQFSTSPDRGLYRTEDGGTNWSKVLFVSDSTGACDVVINPVHPESVFCATWERVRRPSYRRAYGPECGVFRSVDFGSNWIRLLTGLPTPTDSVGRPALAIAPSKPGTIYARFVGGAVNGYNGLGVYRSTNGGSTWQRRDASGFLNGFGGFGWYFGDFVVDPSDANRVYSLGVQLRRSTDGGVNFASTSNAHADGHALWVDPANPAHLYYGCDGGFFSSTSSGGAWTKSMDLPITQFYAGAIDPSNPNRLMGGTQDNYTLLSGGSPSNWQAVLGGDGFQCQIDPTDAQVMFAEWQFCSQGSGLQRSIDGGFSFQSPIGFAGGDRYNWSAPIVMDPNDHTRILVGSQRVYRSTDNGQHYSTISNDLTTNPPASLVYGTLTTLDISPVAADLYYAGTDDGKVWRYASGTWTDISAGLPVRWVTRVTADRFNSTIVYVTLSGFGMDEHLPHVYRSNNQGASWTPIAGNLPDVPLNDIVVDTTDPSTLFVASDVGVYATRNGGASWFPLGTGMPVQTIFDLTIHGWSHTLVAATHGRGQWKLDLSGLPTDVEARPQVAGLRLSEAAPNPSRDIARLTLDVPVSVAAAGGMVEASVYDATGRRVRSLHSGTLGAGRSDLSWDGRDDRGARSSAGIYFVRVTAGGALQMRRIVRVQ